MTILLAQITAGMQHGDRVTLSGTTGSPNYATDIAGVALAGWRFDANGNVYKEEAGDSVLFNSSLEWVIPHTYEDGPYWIRYTHDTGQTENWISSDVQDTWLALTSDRVWKWTSNLGLRIGAGKIEISTASDGNPVVATGYYGGDVEGT